MRTALGIGIVALLQTISDCGGGAPPAPFDCDAQAPAGLVAFRGPAALVIPEEYIVAFREPLAGDVAKAIEMLQAAVPGVKELQRYQTVLKGVHVRMSAGAARAVSLVPFVRFVQPNTVKSIPPDERAAAKPPWGLLRIDTRALADVNGQYEPVGTGKGVHVFSVDTGVDCSHPEFAGRVGESFSAIGGSGCTDGQGHGSHTAGTFGGKAFGVAREATIHSCKFLNSQGQGSDADAIACFDWLTKLCTDNGWRCVANNSWGGTATPAIDQAQCKSIKDGIVHVNAAGNDNLNANNYSPSRVKQAIKAGASDDRDNSASFSNTGDGVSIYAPGVQVESIGGAMSGTSMASPHVAGAAALLLELGQGSDGDPWTPADVKAQLLKAATPDVIKGGTSDTTNALLFVGKEGPPPSPQPTPTPTPSPGPTPTPVPCPSATPCPCGTDGTEEHGGCLFDKCKPCPTPTPTPSPSISPSPCPPCPSPSPSVSPSPDPSPSVPPTPPPSPPPAANCPVEFKPTTTGWNLLTCTVNGKQVCGSGTGKDCACAGEGCTFTLPVGAVCSADSTPRYNGSRPNWKTCECASGGDERPCAEWPECRNGEVQRSEYPPGPRPPKPNKPGHPGFYGWNCNAPTEWRVPSGVTYEAHDSFGGTMKFPKKGNFTIRAERKGSPQLGTSKTARIQ